METHTEEIRRLAYRHILSTTYELTQRGDEGNCFSAYHIKGKIPFEHRQQSKHPYGRLELEGVTHGLDALCGLGLVERFSFVGGRRDSIKHGEVPDAYRANIARKSEIKEFLREETVEDKVEAA